MCRRNHHFWLEGTLWEQEAVLLTPIPGKTQTNQMCFIEPIGVGITANISLLSLDEIPATKGCTRSASWTAKDARDTTWTVTIHELPEIGNLTVNPGEVCSEGTIELALDSYSVDDGLDASDATWTWSATLNDPAGTVTIEGNGDNVTASPKLPELPSKTSPDRTP